MKAVLRSIQPRFIELIAAGLKTIEIGKDRPKELDCPFKVYMYQSKHPWVCSLLRKSGNEELAERLERKHGKVIGEFICDHIKRVVFYTPGGIEIIDKVAILEACLPILEISRYANGRDVYAWYITDLVIYENPKELSEFFREGDCDGGIKCKICPHSEKGNKAAGLEDDCIAPFDTTKRIPITRPPQSWCYVEESV